jgi:hypothetical protein
MKFWSRPAASFDFDIGPLHSGWYLFLAYKFDHFGVWKTGVGRLWKIDQRLVKTPSEDREIDEEIRRSVGMPEVASRNFLFRSEITRNKRMVDPRLFITPC